MIPVTAYILVACVECYRRYPEMIEAITDAMAPEELGRAGHRFGTQIDNVHLWAVPNFALIGRKVLAAAGMVDWDEDARRMAIVLRLLGSRRSRRIASTTGAVRLGTPAAWPLRTAATSTRSSGSADPLTEVGSVASPG